LADKELFVKKMDWWFVPLFLVYPVLRYNVFGTVPWVDYPLYVLNKSICLYTSFALLMYAVTRGRAPAEAEGWLHRTLLTALAHVLISGAILSPEYYAKLYAHGKLTAWGGGAMLAGVLGAVVYWRQYCNSVCLARLNLPLGYGALLVAVHLFGSGYKGWLTPAKWPLGVMVPITLICFIPTLLAGGLLLAGRKTGAPPCAG
jgi:hypothetical protein